ncbi:hypothetical protein K439DRAFT_1636800 [Ramaria rubella]|nr:hypothetical protein K439DRAFT_1636800 [Ramaria rubella]
MSAAARHGMMVLLGLVTNVVYMVVSFDDKHDTATTTADYPAFDRYGGNQLPYLTGWWQWLGSVVRYIDGCHTPLQGRDAALVVVLQFVALFSKTLMNLSLARSSSPPSPRQLLAGIRSRQPESPNKRHHSPTRFLSLSSPSSSTAAALISGPYGPKASGSSQVHGSPGTKDEIPQFCDRCVAAYPMEMFASHECEQ